MEKSWEFYPVFSVGILAMSMRKPAFIVVQPGAIPNWLAKLQKLARVEV